MIKQIVEKQREYFLSKKTYDIDFRMRQLKKLFDSLKENRQLIFDAFKKDYNKCEFDVVATELGMVNMEIAHMLKNIKKFAKVRRVRTDLMNFPSKGYIFNEPYGVTLIMSPWNYPLQLSLMPLVGAIAAGNTVVLKPSDYTYNVARALKKILSVFDEEYVSVVLGGRHENAELLDQRFDFIFFTGGDVVARLVMEKAAKNLTPVLLELGGKSPCIVNKDADIELAAKRIAWGKFLNCGQTCVAPDYIYIHSDIKDAFLQRLKFYITRFYYTDGKLNDNFAFVINDKHAQRLNLLIDKSKIIFGGSQDGRRLEPTVLDNVTRGDAVMGEEIFGPILPILEFNDINSVMAELDRLDKPLAFYYFSKNIKQAKRIIQNYSFGGGCINDVIMHLTNSKMPFGGVGKSGMGSYHSAKSFEAFSHLKSVFVKGKIEINSKFPPYNDKKLNLIKFITKTK